MADLPPPSYKDAISQSNNSRLPITHHDTLVLDGHTIYPASPPSQFLYQISRSPSQSSYAVEKWCFRLPDAPAAHHDGNTGPQDHPDTALKSRLHHIYDIQKQTVALPNSLSLSLRPAIKLDGRAGNRHSYRQVLLQGGHTGWTTCAATEGWFRADVSLRERFKRDGRISWRSRDGLVVAEETRAPRGGDARSLPRLEIRAALAERDLDLLVACWVARVFKDAERCDWWRDGARSKESRGRKEGGDTMYFLYILHLQLLYFQVNATHQDHLMFLWNPK
ncbi:hypothetical protein E4U21_004687 [Claviceps maximensis]|nr:hypothetical protein E4U21_004687 [Claviceps maximensis]